MLPCIRFDTARWWLAGVTRHKDEHGPMEERHPFAEARERALRYLAAAPRTIHEVRRHLERRKYDADTIARVLDTLTDAGLLDDRAFALAWVESRSRSRLLGRVRLEAELRQRGVAKELIEEALSTLPEEDDHEHALTLARTFIGSQDAGDPAVRRRLAGYLLRRGHLWDTIEKVLLELQSKD